jgi:WD40 repeat protein
MPAPKRRRAVALCKHEDAYPTGIWFSADDTRVAVSGDHSVCIYSTAAAAAAAQAKLPPLRKIGGHAEILRPIMDPQLRWFAYKDQHKLMKFSMRTGECMATIEMPSNNNVRLWSNRINNVATSEDGQRLALACNDGMVRVLDAQTFEQLLEFATGDDVMSCVGFVGQGGYVTGSTSKIIKRWTKDGKLMFVMDTFLDQLCLRMAVSPSGERLLSTNYEGVIRIWNANTGQLLNTFAGHRKYIECAFFVNDDLCITFSADKTMAVWSTRHKGMVRRIRCNTHNDYARLSHDGRTLATYARDGMVRLYRDDALPWSDWLPFRFDGSNFRAMPPQFRLAARTFLLCCLRHRRNGEGGGVLAWLPRDMRQLVLVELSLS